MTSCKYGYLRAKEIRTLPGAIEHWTIRATPSRLEVHWHSERYVQVGDSGLRRLSPARSVWRYRIPYPCVPSLLCAPQGPRQ